MNVLTFINPQRTRLCVRLHQALQRSLNAHLSYEMTCYSLVMYQVVFLYSFKNLLTVYHFEGWKVWKAWCPESDLILIQSVLRDISNNEIFCAQYFFFFFLLYYGEFIYEWSKLKWQSSINSNLLCWVELKQCVENVTTLFYGHQ